jgi:hypothetical protein
MKKNILSTFLIVITILSLFVSCDDTEYASMYVTSKKIDADNNVKYIAFVQDTIQESKYYGFEIVHEIDTSSSVYTNQFRLSNAYVYEVQYDVMVKSNLTALLFGENEFAYRTENKVDFTGGFHGDEKMKSATFFINGKEIDSTEEFALKPCKEFKYTQVSSMHETNSENDTIVNNHAVEAIHHKTSTFSNHGYKTENKIEWKKDIVSEKVYGSIVSLARDFGTYGKSKTIDKTAFDASGLYALQSTDKKMNLWNDQKNTTVTVESNFSVHNETSTQFIWDHKGYIKYYRDIGNVEIKKGAIWNLTTDVRFSMN